MAEVEGFHFFAADSDARLGGDGFGYAAGELDAVDSQRMACGNGGLVGEGDEARAGAAHLLLEQPGGGVGRFTLERVGADQFAELSGLVRRGEDGLAVGICPAHLVELDFAAEAGGGKRGLRTGEAAADDADFLR